MLDAVQIDAHLNQSLDIGSARLQDGTYRGALTIDVAGKPKVFDARSSDAIALAVRFKAPILLDPSLVESVGVERRAEPRPDPI
jgi:bifunctional DNase/RNase